MKSGKSESLSVEKSCASRICGGEDCFLASIDRSIAFGALRLDGERRVVCAHGALTRRLPVSVDTYLGKRIGDFDEALAPRIKDLERWLLEIVSSRKGVFFEKNCLILSAILHVLVSCYQCRMKATAPLI